VVTFVERPSPVLEDLALVEALEGAPRL